MDKTVEEAWAQLVCTTDVDCQPFPIYQEKFTIGRAKACDISLGDNKLVSGTHCYIQRNNKGEAWLHDSSTNGTLLNMVTKLTKGESRLLSHGDEFFVVYKKNNEELNIGYVYQDMKELAKEEESDEETQEYNVADATLADEEINLVPSPTQGFKRPQTSRDEDPPSKRSKPDESSSKEKLPVETNDDKKQQTDDKTEIKMKVDESGDKQSDVQSSASNSKDIATKPPEKDDALAESLLCIICQEILHDCISLQPCMHSFCAGCYSDWMERSSECPSCRLKAERINKNHIVNNLVEAYLKEHPDKKRPEEEIKELDSRNKITRDMLYPVKPKKDGYSFGEESDDYEDSVEEPDSDDDDVVPPPPYVTLPRPAATGHLFGLPFGVIPPPKTVCRQCPEYKEPVPTACVTDVGKDKSELADNCDGAGPSTDLGEGCSNPDAKIMPSPPPKFVCGPMQNHYLCNCCLEPMPDRRLERPGNPLIRPQQCSLCQNGFCHLYWGCRRVNCEGCLGKFNDFNFGKKCLVSLVLDNAHESEILKNYLESKNMSVKDLLKVCIEKKDSGEYTCTGTAGNYNMHFGRKLESDAIICYACALRYFKELAYQYRRDIPNTDLPEAVTKRPDCYWGKNCRTQRNKPAHALTFNHICEQTRTA
ncbi:E3 ubiquitin-protein ligase CHFR isoform X1 [Patella vulgata]|uniref:E3 ubiquitin-protein ligase CHFR isoform X1 n=1 Tax=Patella vulgata TaxID=6465 RepID=UPI002180637D|nr:E3 ubiquitin-protein ligase CHFR isoform X1 [Patella vulgata]